MTTIWNIHMGAHVGSNPIDEDYVGMSWQDQETLPSQLAPTREAFKDYYSKQEGVKIGAIPVIAGIAYRFWHEIAKNDLIIYPSKHDRMVNIGRTTDERFFVEISQDDEIYAMRLKVKWIACFPRAEFSQATLNMIGTFITLSKITENITEFTSKIGISPAIAHEDEIQDDRLEFGDVTQKAIQNTEDFVISQLYSQLSGFEFEGFIAHLFQCMGYSARTTQRSGDGGVDVIAHKDKLGFEPPIIKIQCKRKLDNTGEPEINQLIGTLGEGEYAMFVNLGSYSTAARHTERNRSKIRLIDGITLVSLILEHYENLDPKYRIILPLKRVYLPNL